MRHAIILAGGSGTRLWPVSRESLPKQLIPFIRGKSLLGLTLERLDGLVDRDNRLICTGEKHVRIILENSPGIRPETVLGEPEGRDTLAALAFGCSIIVRRDPSAVVSVVTADHLIRPVEAFHELMRGGYEFVETNPDRLVTFGVRPDHPSTGFGYLELGGPVPSGDGAAMRVRRFVEKPDLPTAERFFAEAGTRYLWNSGMFVWKAARFLDLVRELEPAVYDGVSRIADSYGTPDYDGTLKSLFPSLRKTSVDYAVMEPASVRDSVVAFPLEAEWRDIGSWPAFAETCAADERMNAVSAEKTVLVDSGNNLVVSDAGHLVCLLGCDDLIVVHTEDATLICRRDRAQDIKKVHAEVKVRFGSRFTD